MLKATRCRKAYGFTLIELTVVLVIIGILGTLIVTRIAGSTDDARIMKARHDVRQIFNGAEVFYASDRAVSGNVQGTAHRSRRQRQPHRRSASGE